MFGDCHRLRLGLRGLLENAVFAGVQQMPDVGQVLHVQHVEAAVAQVAHDHIEGNIGLGVTDVRFIVDGRPADVHADSSRFERDKILFFASKNVEYPQRHKVVFPS